MIGNGCKVGYSDLSPHAWTQITNVVDLAIPLQTADRVDKTVHSTSRLKRYEPGMEDVSDAWFTVLQDLSDATQKKVRDLKAAREKVWWRFEVPTNDALTTFVGFEFEGRVASFEPAVPIAGEQTTKYTLMFDGESIEETANGASLF